VVGGGRLGAVPLVCLPGGVDGSLRALGTQAGEDFAWTGMLWMNPTPRRLAFALWETLVLPWDHAVLAAVVLIVSAIGVLVALLRDRRALLLTALAFAPYGVFQLVFQETAHVRYALPTLPLVVWFAVRAAGAAPFLVAPIALFALAIAVASGAAYSREP